jgi:hypothetical protein
MAQYRVNHRYASFRDGRGFGPFDPDTVIELDEADAEWINRDSPGTLDDIAADTEESGVDPDGEAEPVKDRAHKGGRTRKADSGGA